MGDSSSTTQNEETTTVGYNPCYYFQLAAKGVLKCLGLDSCPPPIADKKINETSYEDNSSSSTEEQGMKSNEDVEAMFSYTEITINRRPPPRPPVNRGSSPGIN